MEIPGTIPQPNEARTHMKLFECQNCGNALHFDNTICLNCAHRVGYLQERFEMSALEETALGWRALGHGNAAYRFCANAAYDACNWLIRSDSEPQFCESCRHNRTIPDLSIPGNVIHWRKIELAKRYVFRSLMRWRLRAPSRIENPKEGLAFDFLSDPLETEGAPSTVLTGHADGVITLNIAEADDAERERRRSSMGETYRTLVGHFRHELGHYFWDRLVRDTDRLSDFRAVFGDETQDYEAALERHYEYGAPTGWQDAFISAYASSHPWEDFAETWAHYIHMVDALETARSYGINVSASFNTPTKSIDLNFEPYGAASAAQLVQAWIPLTVAINGVNRSMGQPDLYPFVLSQPVLGKLEFIHDLIHRRRQEDANGALRSSVLQNAKAVEVENVQ
jgi:hypothetical protein